MKRSAQTHARATRDVTEHQSIYDWLSSMEEIGVIIARNMALEKSWKLQSLAFKAPFCLEFWFLTGLHENVLVWKLFFSRLSIYEWDIRCGVVFDDPAVFLKKGS